MYVYIVTKNYIKNYVTGTSIVTGIINNHLI